jgi:hypothetical protein
MIDSTSIGAWVVSPRFVIHFAPSPSESRAMGRMMANSHRQPGPSTMNPDSVGPIAGASAMTMPTRPIMRPRWREGTTFMIVVMSSGSMMPVPPAWMIRPVSSMTNPLADRHTSVPRENREIAARKI